MNEALRACPCCGNAARLSSKSPDYFSEKDWTKSKHKIKCTVCPITTGWISDKDKLIIGWNTRAGLSGARPEVEPDMWTGHSGCMYSETLTTNDKEEADHWKAQGMNVRAWYSERPRSREAELMLVIEGLKLRHGYNHQSNYAFGWNDCIKEIIAQAQATQTEKEGG